MDSAVLLAEMRAALVQYGLAVAATDGFKAWDLNIVLPPAMRVPLNASAPERRPHRARVAHQNRTDAHHHRGGGDLRRADRCRLSAIGAIGGDRARNRDRCRAAIVRLQRVPSLLAASAEAIAEARGLKIAVHRAEKPFERRVGIYGEVHAPHAAASVALRARGRRSARCGAAMEVLKPWPLKIVIDNVLRGKPLRSSRALAQLFAR